MPRHTTTLWDSWPVIISGEELRDARNRAQLSQTELAQLLRHSLRTIQKWEDTGVTQGKEALVRDRLRNYLTTHGEPQTLESYSDLALLMEIGRRLVRSTEESMEEAPPGKQRGRGANKTTDDDQS